MSRYRWEPEAGTTGRYRDTKTGRFVSPTVIRSELDTLIDNASKGVAEQLTTQLRDGAINLQDWQLAMMKHVKQTTLAAVALERGGFNNMSLSDYGRAGQLIRTQYDYLQNFANEIESGKQRLDGTAMARAALYTKSAREAFYVSKQAHGVAAGLTHVRSIRNSRDSCRECLDLDHKIFRIGDPAYKLPGRRLCSKNCLCTEEYLVFDGIDYRVVGA
jgi:hypothetical protein